MNNQKQRRGGLSICAAHHLTSVAYENFLFFSFCPPSVTNRPTDTERPAPPTINVATLTAHFVIDPQDILWFSHCEDVNVRTVDTAFESFLVRQKDELAISAEMAQTVGDELIRIIKHAVLRGVSVRHSFAHFDQQCKG